MRSCMSAAPWRGGGFSQDYTHRARTDEPQMTPEPGARGTEEEVSRKGAKTPRRPPEEPTTDCTDNTDKEEIRRQHQRLCLSLLSFSVVLTFAFCVVLANSPKQLVGG